MKTEKINVQKICLIAFAICINFVGGQIALFLKLPIYLDSIGCTASRKNTSWNGRKLFCSPVYHRLH